MRYIMSGRNILQHLKALERAPHGTLAFRSYLLKICRVISHNKAFGSLEALQDGTNMLHMEQYRYFGTLWD